MKIRIENILVNMKNNLSNVIVETTLKEVIDNFTVQEINRIFKHKKVNRNAYTYYRVSFQSCPYCRTMHKTVANRLSTTCKNCNKRYFYRWDSQQQRFVYKRLTKVLLSKTKINPQNLKKQVDPVYGISAECRLYDVIKDDKDFLLAYNGNEFWGGKVLLSDKWFYICFSCKDLTRPDCLCFLLEK